jgi:glycerol-3-phosphate dehydrogenase
VVDGHWQVSFKTEGERSQQTVKARMVVNAAGPWVDDVLNLAKPPSKDFNVKLVKGSHIIIPKLFDGNAAYILQNDDRRVIFAIPYEKHYTLVGTTDHAYEGLPDGVRAEMSEVDYLCRAINAYFKTKIKADDVLWTYSGVRPLLDDGQDNLSTITRDYVLNEMVVDEAPLLNVYGGKLTTYRKLSEQAVDFITARLRPEMFERYWTHYTPLPGGDIQALDFESFFKNMKRTYGWMPEKILYRYARAYGSRLRVLLKGCRKIEDLGEYLGDDLYSLEIEYLLQIEMAMTAEDIIWRRSKLGLHISDETLANLERYLDDYYQRA